MCRSIRVRTFNASLDPDKQRVNINKFPAATARQIRHYAHYALDEDHPSQVIIVAGTNDVAYDTNSSGADPEIIAERIMDIARDCRSKNVKDIHVSSIMPRREYRYRSTIDQINTILRRKCDQEHFYYIDNANIYTGDLDDGVHLNYEGNQKFISNLLNCCSSYNPYLFPYL
jgi:lysophospholipase L1-like esterase